MIYPRTCTRPSPKAVSRSAEMLPRAGKPNVHADLHAAAQFVPMGFPQWIVKYGSHKISFHGHFHCLRASRDECLSLVILKVSTGGLDGTNGETTSRWSQRGQRSARIANCSGSKGELHEVFLSALAIETVDQWSSRAYHFHISFTCNVLS